MADASAPAPRLSLTEYAVLGLLTFGPASGYDLDQLAGRSLVYFWRPAKSKIYAALPRLVEQGLATSRELVQHRRRDKQLYRLTAAGRRALREWLDEEELPPSVVRSGLLLKLFFGAEADEAKIRKDARGLEGPGQGTACGPRGDRDAHRSRAGVLSLSDAPARDRGRPVDGPLGD